MAVASKLSREPGCVTADQEVGIPHVVYKELISQTCIHPTCLVTRPACPHIGPPQHIDFYDVDHLAVRSAASVDLSVDPKTQAPRLLVDLDSPMRANLLKIRIGTRPGKAESLRDRWVPASYPETPEMTQSADDVLLFELYIDKWKPCNHPLAKNDPGVIDQVIVQRTDPAKVQNYSAECVWSMTGRFIRSGESVEMRVVQRGMGQNLDKLMRTLEGAAEKVAEQGGRFNR